MSEVCKVSSTGRRTGSRSVGSFQLPAVFAFLILLFATASMVVAQSSGGSSSGSGSSGSSSGSTGTTGTSSSGSGSASSQNWNSIQSSLRFSGKVETSGVLKVEFSRQDGPFKEEGFNRQPEYIADGYLAFYRPNGAGTGASGSTGTSGSTGSTSGATAGGSSSASTANRVFVAGEIPLRENEVANFEQTLERANVWIPAVHNHEIRETPRLIFIHIETMGDGDQVARAIRQAMDQSKANFKEDQPKEVSQTSISGLSNVAGTIGYHAKLEEDNGVLTLTIPRSENFSDCLVAIDQANGSGAGAAGTGSSGSSSSSSGSGSSSGTASNGTSTGSTNGSSSGNASATGMTSAGVQASNNCLLQGLQATSGTSGATGGTNGTTSNSGSNGTSSSTSGTAAGANQNQSQVPAEVGAVSEFRFEMGGNGSVDVDAEFALLSTEAPQTLRLLRENGFVVSALHNHFAFESPRLLFLHASGQGTASKLAQVIRMALDQNTALMGCATSSTSGNGTSGSGTSSGSTGSTGSTGSSGSTGTASGSSSTGTCPAP